MLLPKEICILRCEENFQVNLLFTNTLFGLIRPFSNRNRTSPLNVAKAQRLRFAEHGNGNGIKQRWNMSGIFFVGNFVLTIWKRTSIKRRPINGF